MVTGQSYQDFVNGYACTGWQTVSENWENGDQVNFNLSAYDQCTGVMQYFTGTDTVQGGKIVARAPSRRARGRHRAATGHRGD